MNSQEKLIKSLKDKIIKQEKTIKKLKIYLRDLNIFYKHEIEIKQSIIQDLYAKKSRINKPMRKLLSNAK